MMLSSEIIKAYHQRRIFNSPNEGRMKSFDGFQHSFIQQNLQCHNNTRFKSLKILQSNVFTRSTVSSYNSDLLKNTHQYRISNNSGLRDILGMSKVVSQSTPILGSFFSSPDYSGLLQLRTKRRTAATEYLDTSTQVIGSTFSVSTGSQTLSSKSVEVATQTLSNQSEASTQTNFNMTPAASEASTTIISASTNSWKTSDVNDTTGSNYTDSGVQAVSVNGTSIDNIVTPFQKLEDAFEVALESLKTTIEKLKRDVDRFGNSESFGCNHLDIEDSYCEKDFFYDPSPTPEYFYSYNDSSTTSNTDKLDVSTSEYFYSYKDTTPKTHKSSSSYEHCYTVEDDDFLSDCDASSTEQFIPPMVANEHSSTPPPQYTNSQEQHISSFNQKLNLSQHDAIMLSTNTDVHVHDTSMLSTNTEVHVHDAIMLSTNTDVHVHDAIMLSTNTEVHVHDAKSSNHDSSSQHDTINDERAISKHYDITENKFDIRNLVTINSFGQFSLNASTMFTMYGFDPRNSPFVYCGYHNIGNLPENLNSMVIEDIKRRDIIYERNADKTFKEIGRGTYGVVYLARMKNIKNKVVIKQFHHRGISWEEVEREAQILTYLKGQDITPNFLGVLTSRKKSRAYSLVQEYYGHGTVEDMLLNYDLSPAVWIMICKNICQILFKIHCNHILFNDLKSDNILVDLNNFDIRFIDFGMATFRSGISFGGCTGIAECVFYGPEVREGSFSTPQSDIYSLGHLFKQILKHGNVYQLFPLYKSCTRIKAIDRSTLPEIMDILDRL